MFEIGQNGNSTEHNSWPQWGSHKRQLSHLIFLVLYLGLSKHISKQPRIKYAINNNQKHTVIILLNKPEMLLRHPSLFMEYLCKTTLWFVIKNTYNFLKTGYSLCYSHLKT